MKSWSSKYWLGMGFPAFLGSLYLRVSIIKNEARKYRETNFQSYL